VKQVPTTRPAEEPGTPLEPSRKRRPREMVTHDKIRLTGLLRKPPQRGGFYLGNSMPSMTSSFRSRSSGVMRVIGISWLPGAP
jgi:hypothetical protein